MRSKYHEIRIKKIDIEKNGFKPCLGHYEYVAISLELTNVSATFVTLINSIFCDHLGKFVLLLIDDMMIYSKTEEEHEQHLKQIFENLRENELYAKLSECTFFTSRVEFLSHAISYEIVYVDPRNINVVA